MSLTLAADDRVLWERFLEGRFSHDQVGEHPLLARWARAQRAGASAEGQAHPIGVTDARVRAAREKLAPLVDIGSPFEAFAEAVDDAGFGAFLADADGVVVRQQGRGELEPTLIATRLLEGARWDEIARGTNAIGTALEEKAPVAVIGAAHYERRNHGLVCYAAPIRDAYGEIAAILDATGPVAHAGAFAHAAVVAAASALEALWIARAYDEAITGGLFALERSLAALPHAAFVLESTGRVRLANSAARALLSATERRDARAFLDKARAHFRVEIEDIGSDRLAGLVHLRPRIKPSTRVVDPAFATIVGSDPAIADARERASRFATTDLPVLLLAETGSGKELFARAIHSASGRSKGPFVAINCGALTGSLLESELFGYGPGSFTGARSSGSSGKLAAAHRGTLFLDEVAEMPAALQAMLLRFLEDGAYYRVGENEERRADVRIVAATCRNLPALVESGTFRNDLYYRIRGATVRLPPLRERTDRLELTRVLLARIAEKHALPALTLSPSAEAFVTSHRWPGNVRELRTALEHALVLADGDRIERAHFPALDVEATETSLDASERTALLRALESSQGNLSDTARKLGVARTTLYRMLTRHGLRS